MENDRSNVGTPSPDGAGGNQPPVSQTQGQPIAGTPQGSQEFSTLVKRLDQTEKELRGLQSRQDKEKNETQRLLDDIKTQIDSGKSFEEAQRSVLASRKAEEKDDLLLKIAQKVGVLGESSQPVPAGTGAQATSGTAQVLSKAGLDANTPEVIELIQKYGSDPVDFAMKIGEYKAGLANRPQASATGSTVLQGPPPGGAPDEKKLTEEYKTKVAGARGNAAEIRRLIGEYEKKGVKVHEISF